MVEPDINEPVEAITSAESKLVAACERGDWDVVKEMAQNKIFSPRQSNTGDYLPISWLFEQHLNDSDKASVLKLVLEHDVDSLLRKDSNGRTALSYAAEYTDVHCVDYLLNTQQIPTEDMIESLRWVGGRHQQIMSEHFRKDTAQVIRRLIEMGVDVSKTHMGLVPLVHALHLGSKYVVDWFCMNSSELVPEAFTSRDSEDRSPLSIAVFNKLDWAIVPLLNTGHYDCDQDRRGRTPIYWLLRSEREGAQKEELAKILIWKEAHDDYRGVRFGPEPFELKSRGVKDLENAGIHVDPEMLNQYQKDDEVTLLSYAAQHDEGEVISAMLGIHGIRADAPNKDSTTPLQIALMKNSARAAKVLMEADRSTFKELIRISDVGLLQKLLELGYDVNREENSSQPLLHYVVEKATTDVAEKLLRIILDPARGKELEDINQLDRRQKTALQLAQGKVKLMHLLLSHGAYQNRITMEKDGWFEMHTTASGLLLKRGRNRGIEFEFKDLTAWTRLPCCPGDTRIGSGESILVHKDHSAWENRAQRRYRPGRYECCGRQWRKCGILFEFPHRERESKKSLLGIEWITEIKENGEEGRVLYSSTLPRVWLPHTRTELLKELLGALSAQWQSVYDYVNGNMIIHVKHVREHILAYREDYSYDTTKLLSNKIDRVQESAMEQLDQFEQVLTNMLQLEFARTSINEAASIRRITLVTFVYLPLMFSASLFGMNVNALENNPDWRWYILFAGASFLVTFGIYFYPFTGIWSQVQEPEVSKRSTTMNRLLAAQNRGPGSVV